MRRILHVKRRRKHSSQRQLYVQWQGAMERPCSSVSWLVSSSAWRRLGVVLGERWRKRGRERTVVEWWDGAGMQNA